MVLLVCDRLRYDLLMWICLLRATFAFSFLSGFGIAWWVRTVTVWVSRSVATATFAFACISSFPFFVSGVSDRHGIVA